MRTKQCSNPREDKTYDPNYEPWLTWRELFIEAEVLKECYSKWK